MRSIANSRQAFVELKDLFDKDQEEFWCICLNSKKQIIEIKLLHRGTVDQCLVHPRDLFRFALSVNASAVLVAHNHPSGDTLASDADIKITKLLIEASKLVQIPLVDHLVVSSNEYSSMADEAIVKF